MQRRTFLAGGLASALAGCSTSAPFGIHPHVKPSLDPKAIKPVQLLVVGGTPAGVAAAVTAARRGVRVALAVEGAYLGGILTGAMMDQWDYNLTTDGRRIQGGFFQTLVQRLGDGFTPEQAKAVFAAIVAGYPLIHTAYGTRAVTAHVEHETVARVGLVRDGVKRFVAPAFVVDATDGGDFAALAGARYGIGRQDEGKDAKMQAVTLLFAMSGVDWNALTASYDRAAYGYGHADAIRAYGFSKVLKGYTPGNDRVYIHDLNMARTPSGLVTVNAINVFGVDGRDPKAVAEARTIVEDEAPRLVAYLREHLPGMADARVARYAEQVYVRETRHIAGLATLREGDIWNHKIPYDTIGLASYPMDLHPAERGDHLGYAAQFRTYGVPFRAMVPRGFTNLLVASPAISATHVAAGSARVIPTTIEEGEAAGAAVALALRERLTMPAIANSPPRMTQLRSSLAATGSIFPSGLSE